MTERLNKMLKMNLNYTYTHILIDHIHGEDNEFKNNKNDDQDQNVFFFLIFFLPSANPRSSHSNGIFNYRVISQCFFLFLNKKKSH